MSEKKDMKTKDTALALFLTGLSLAKISESTGVPISTIQSWKQMGGWQTLKQAVILSTETAIGKDMSKIISKEAEEHIKSYRTMQEKGLEQLVERDARSAGEAGELIDKGIKGERDIARGLITYRFVAEIARIIADEVRDEDVKRRIAERLKGLLLE